MRPDPLATADAPVSFADQTFAGADFIARSSPTHAGATLWRREALARALSEADDDGALIHAAAAWTGARLRHIAQGLVLGSAGA